MRKRLFKHRKRYDLILSEPEKIKRASKWLDLMLMLLLILSVFIFTFCIYQIADATELDALPKTTFSAVSQGELLFRSPDGQHYHLAPKLHTDVDIVITGMLARTVVKQQFINQTHRWIEGLYVFPLPENAAVDHMKMQIGERVLEAQIKERQVAKKIYQRARTEGKKASLIEQERPNLFTNSVANIGPGEEVTVQIEYQNIVQYEQGEFQLRFPMAITPRYIPGKPLQEELHIAPAGAGWSINTDKVKDASRITPPVYQTEKNKNRISIKVELNVSLALEDVTSPYHKIRADRIAMGHYLITLGQENIPAERDFVLQWKPQPQAQPRAAIFTEQLAAEDYHLLMIMPPWQEAAKLHLNKEVIYVIDTSGSMGGTSIRQARRALLTGVERLQPDDRFNIIQFNSQHEMLFPTSVAASRHNLDAARRYVLGLQAGGGTEMSSALHAALPLDSEGSAVRQVIFITDGSVGNERTLFDLIKQRLQQSRLFTVGIGSAPNSFFMRKAASFGRGTFTYIGDVAEVEEKMSQLLNKISMPLMTDLDIEWPQESHAEYWPERVPDLYHGQPLLLLAKTSLGLTDITAKGRLQQQPWQATLSIKGKPKQTGIARAWARAKIGALMDKQHDGVGEQLIRPQVIELALQHHLVSRYTSLVAVDITPTRPIDQTSNTTAVPTALPLGQYYQAIFASLAKTATPAARHLLIGVGLMLLAWLVYVCYPLKGRRYGA